MKTVLAKRFLLFAAIWLVLSGGAPSGWVVGLFAATAAAWLSCMFMPAGVRRVDFLAVCRLMPGFAARSFMGGMDVARRALDPRLPLDAGWIAYRTKLPSHLARIWLGSETTLFPGSLVAGRRGDLLYIHCLDRGQDIAGQIKAEEARIAATLREAKGKPRGA